MNIFGEQARQRELIIDFIEEKRNKLFGLRIVENIGSQSVYLANFGIGNLSSLVCNLGFKRDFVGDFIVIEIGIFGK